MKIDDAMKKAGGLPVSSTQTRAGKGADKSGGVSKPASSTTSGTSDNVHLSSQVQALAGQAGSEAVFNTNKVEEIKAAIAGGRFQVDAEKVADGLLDTVKDLIHTRKA